jgi:hypothetical protein
LHPLDTTSRAFLSINNTWKAFFYNVSPFLQILAKRIIVGIDGEIVEHELNSPLPIFALLSKIFLPPETGMVFWNISACRYPNLINTVRNVKSNGIDVGLAHDKVVKISIGY